MEVQSVQVVQPKKEKNSKLDNVIDNIKDKYGYGSITLGTLMNIENKNKEVNLMTPKEQCEVLLDKLLPFAEDQMKKYREFYPFAAVILMDDSVELTGSYDGNEHPESKDVLADLIQIHKQLAAENKIKASGIVWNAGIASADGKPTDAIIVSLEHKDDYSVIVGEPYKVGLFKKVTFGNLFAMEGKHDIF